MDDWDYQLRVSLEKHIAVKIRNLELDSEKNQLLKVLKKFNAKLVCQYDAFSEYVNEAEDNGVENYPLYKWTKATIENPEKKEKYLKSFTIYINNNQIYSKDLANELHDALTVIKEENKYIINIAKYDTNPKNNPQVPKEYQ